MVLGILKDFLGGSRGGMGKTVLYFVITEEYGSWVGYLHNCRSLWSYSHRCGSEAARLLGLWV